MGSLCCFNIKISKIYMSTELDIGSQAPDFALPYKDIKGNMQTIKLSDNYDKCPTVLFFVPLAFTPVCTKTFCSITQGNDWNAVREIGAEVYGISVDSPFVLEAWAKDQ